MTTKVRILKAAERIVLREGVSKLTIEAVAAEARLSKGGVLYNFASKEDLIKGMVAHLHDNFEADWKRHLDLEPEAPGRRLRALLKANFPPPGHPLGHDHNVAAALIAALATNPSLLDPMRARDREVQSLLMDDGIDPLLAMVISAAADGLWLRDLFGIDLAPEIHDQVIEYLQKLTYGKPPCESGS